MSALPSAEEPQLSEFKKQDVPEFGKMQMSSLPTNMIHQESLEAKEISPVPKKPEEETKLSSLQQRRSVVSPKLTVTDFDNLMVKQMSKEPQPNSPLPITTSPLPTTKPVKSPVLTVE